MKKPIVIIGIGELSGVFAKAFLRNGHPVYPVTRGMDISEEADRLPDPELVLVAVAEKDYPAVMESMPNRWKSRLVLLQNELLPHDWQRFGVEEPTVISVWFEKKKGSDSHVLLPSPVYGAVAQFITESLEKLGIPCKMVHSKEDLIFELVLKNVFVFTINLAGLILAEGTTTSMLWRKNQKLALAVANDVMDMQEVLTGYSFSRDHLREGLLSGIMGDPDHQCKGRSALDRLARVMKIAEKEGLELETIRDIHRRFCQVP